MASERKRFFYDGETLKCEWGLWHEDTQTMPTAFVRDATEDEAAAYASANARELAQYEHPKAAEPAPTGAELAAAVEVMQEKLSNPRKHK